MGLGIGATHEANATMSPTRAAGKLLIMTVAEPIATIPGPAGTQGGIVQGFVISDTRSAGLPPSFTVGLPGGMNACGIGGCGTGVGTGAGG